tara:strand:+ start:164 stop:988 length:825 start_codon:yes stop_codon:yes gene_type:complete
MRKLTKRILCALFTASLLACGTVIWVQAQAKFVPDFYTRAKNVAPLATAEASRQLQQEVKQLQSDAGKRGSWNAAFSDQQVNAWLIEELPRMFPRLLARGAQEPRIMIENGRVLAAVRFQHGRIDTVISCEIQVELTEQPNVLAVRMSNLRAGALPLPLNKFVRGISKEAARGGLDVGWDFTDSGPVALVTIPADDPRYAASPVVVESVNLVRGAMVLAGHTGNMAAEEFRPNGPLHEFVSYQPRDGHSGEREILQRSRLSKNSSPSGPLKSIR